MNGEGNPHMDIFCDGFPFSSDAAGKLVGYLGVGSLESISPTESEKGFALFPSRLDIHGVQWPQEKLPLDSGL